MDLKVERIKLNITQRDLSVLANVGLNTLIKIEKGNLSSVKVGTLQKIADVFGVSMIDLFFNKDN